MKKDEFQMLLKKLGINKKEFAIIADVPYPTVVSWGVSRKGKILEIPNWVRQFLFYYERARTLELITNEICQKLNKSA
jgi:predicted transcriptional regulator